MAEVVIQQYPEAFAQLRMQGLMELFPRSSQLNYSAAESFQYIRKALESIIPNHREKRAYDPLTVQRARCVWLSTPQKGC